MIVVLALVVVVVVAFALAIAFRSPTRDARHSIDRYGSAMRALSAMTTQEREIRSVQRGQVPRDTSASRRGHDLDRDANLGTAAGNARRRDPAPWVPRAPVPRASGAAALGSIPRRNAGVGLQPVGTRIDGGLRPPPSRPRAGLGSPVPPGSVLDPSAADPELPPLARQAARIIGVWEPPGGRDPSVEANARLTGTTGLVLAILFFAEGLTIPLITRLVSWHIVIGLALIPPILVKMGSTLWKFSRYYLGDPRFRRAGPPHPFLRVLGPLVMISTVILMVSGVALWLSGRHIGTLFRIHQLTFVAWFIFVVLHVGAHFLRAVRLAASDSRDAHGERKARRPARVRRGLVAASLLAGLGLGVLGLRVSTTWTRPPTAVRVPRAAPAARPRP